MFFPYNQKGDVEESSVPLIDLSAILLHFLDVGGTLDQALPSQNPQSGVVFVDLGTYYVGHAYLAAACSMLLAPGRKSIL